MKITNKQIELSVGEVLPESLKDKYKEESPGIWKPCFPVCIYHDQVEQTLSCGKLVQSDHCHLKTVLISPRMCQQCKERSCQ